MPWKGLHKISPLKDLIPQLIFWPPLFWKIVQGQSGWMECVYRFSVGLWLVPSSTWICSDLSPWFSNGGAKYNQWCLWWIQCNSEEYFFFVKTSNLDSHAVFHLTLKSILGSLNGTKLNLAMFHVGKGLTHSFALYSFNRRNRFTKKSCGALFGNHLI